MFVRERARQKERERVVKAELQKGNQKGRHPFASLSEPCLIYVGENL